MTIDRIIRIKSTQHVHGQILRTDMIVFSVISKSLPKPKFSPVWASALVPLLLASLSKDSGWMLKKTTAGQPFACNQFSGETAFVSISHSRCLLAVAVSLTVPVGIDIEFHRQRNFQELAAYAFGREEQAMVQNEASPAFYKIWTVREALAKATGINLYDFMDGRDILQSKVNSIQLQDHNYLMSHKTVLSAYSLSLVSKKISEFAPHTCEAPFNLVIPAIINISSKIGANLSEDIIPVEIGPLSLINSQ